MKPLLRAVLLLDALLLAGFGLLFVLTPWKGLYDMLQLVSVEPAMVGQAFGIALLGLAWLSLHAAVNGGLTSGVARAVGHVNWLTGVVMLVWLIGLRTPALSGFGQLVSVVAGAVLLVIGLGGVRLAGAVRRREKVQAAEARAPQRSTEPAAVLPRPVPERAEPVATARTGGAEPTVSSAADTTSPVAEPGQPRDDAPRPPFHG